jgi:hypothetical protein
MKAQTETNETDINPVGPKEPSSLSEAGLAESTIEALILKILYFRGELFGRDLSTAIGLKFSVIESVVEELKLRHHLQVKRSLGMGSVSALFSLSDTGRARAREALEANQYAGAAPVPLDRYIAVVKEQKPKQGWLTRPALEKALSGMVVTEQLLSQIGPAISSANSLLLYGKPGDGKTYLIESVNNIEGSPVFVPYAVECQGNIIQVFDPVYHHRLDEQESTSLLQAVGLDEPYDRRWVKCRRPFIVSGGELTLDMLDLRYNYTSKVYEAPFQLKANNGIYLIDDFGRQRATPAEVLNRWIVPMERRTDYLSFLTGGKMTAPFEAFLVFSTNLNPDDLGDEAFLRRIQYKMLLRGPSRAEFEVIFQKFCASKGIPYPRDVVERFVEKFYVRTGKKFRRCQPRDVLGHALNLIHFEKLPLQLTDRLMERAFESCFLQEEENTPSNDVVFLSTPPKPCADYWAERLEAIPTVFGTLAFLASLCDSMTGVYRDAAAARDYSEGEIGETLSSMHTRIFRQWLGMNLEQQSNDLGDYLSTTDGRTAFLAFNHREVAGVLTPAEAKLHERESFKQGLANLMILISDRHSRREQVAPGELLLQTA